MKPLDIPENQQTISWVQSLLRFIEEQNRVIKEQTEQIAALKTTVQELRDEITRLKNTPKRPKFRPSKTPPQDKNKNTSAPGSSHIPRNTTSKKSKEEVIIKAAERPEGSKTTSYKN
jgi:predicted RNase H-like nuclease (RuvC/YqgF family)